MDRLKAVNLRGYKSIRSTYIELGPINVLIGANGAGKSNFLSFFKMLSALVNNTFQEFVASQGGADSLLFESRKTTERIYAKLDFGSNLYEVEFAPDADDLLYFANETAFFQNENHERPFSDRLGSGHRETRLTRANSKVGKYVAEKMSRWTLYHFHDTSASASVKQSVRINDNFKLAQDAQNLAAFLFLMKEVDQTAYRQIVDVVRLAAPFFDDFVLRANPRNADLIRLQWSQKQSSITFGPHDFSDGTLRFICLATALLQPSPPSVIFIDEPELGLHPYAITLLAGLIRAVSDRCQIIVSTQSVPLVNQFNPEEAVVVERYEGSSIFKSVDATNLSEWLDDYGLGDLWEKNVIGGRPIYAKD